MLDRSEYEQLKNIATTGRVLDGDLISKEIRNKLVSLGYVTRDNGFNKPTQAGLQACAEYLTQGLDSWWTRFRKLYESYVNLENGQPPNLVIMDRASYDMMCQEERKPENKQFFTVQMEFIVVPRCGQSNVQFFHVLRRFK